MKSYYIIVFLSMALLIGCSDSGTSPKKVISEEDIVGTFQSADMGGYTEYLQLWDDYSGEMGTVMVTYKSRDNVVLWNLDDDQLTVEFATEYPFQNNMTSYVFTITEDDGNIILTDTEDSEYTFSTTSDFNISRVLMTADDVVGIWDASTGDGITFNTGGTATQGGESMTWEFAASSHVIYLIDSENYYVELTASMDGSVLKLVDLDNSITYTKQ